jgi:hypothetical protein
VLVPQKELSIQSKLEQINFRFSGGLVMAFVNKLLDDI